MSITNNILNFFKRKKDDQSDNDAPEGMCPVCWGRSEWDGEHYAILKDKHAIPGDPIYDSFISKIVNQHVETTHNLKNKVICTTCDKEIA